MISFLKYAILLELGVVGLMAFFALFKMVGFFLS
jgi:hypothetical protein